MVYASLRLTAVPAPALAGGFCAGAGPTPLGPTFMPIAFRSSSAFFSSARSVDTHHACIYEAVSASAFCCAHTAIAYCDEPFARCIESTEWRATLARCTSPGCFGIPDMSCTHGMSGSTNSRARPNSPASSNQCSRVVSHPNTKKRKTLLPRTNSPNTRQRPGLPSPAAAVPAPAHSSAAFVWTDKGQGPSQTETQFPKGQSRHIPPHTPSPFP
jgi:hypothetical protein